MRIICQQMILMKYHALFVIFEKAAKYEIVVCCKLYVALYSPVLSAEHKISRDNKN